MSDAATIVPSIYRIDLNKIQHLTRDKTTVVTASDADEHILAHQEKQRELGYSKAKPFKKRVGPLKVGNYVVTVYGTDSSYSKPHPWKHLFPEEIPGLDVKYPNLAAFIVSGKECYAISAGQGHNLFDQFVDTSFPLEVAKRIMKPELSATERREIAGAIYGQMQQYRTSQMMISSQTLGTVWRALKGEVTEEIKSNPTFDAIFHPNKRKIAVVANSALTISKSIDVDQIMNLLDWVVNLLDEDLTPEQEENFNFLNGLREISPRKGKADIAELKISLADQIRECLGSNTDIELDYSHKNFIAYQEAHEFSFGGSKQLRNTKWSSPPSATDVIVSMGQAGEFNSCTDGVSTLDVLEKIVFHAEHSEPLLSTHGSILSHLHGEVEYKGKRFFLVDGTWYYAPESFIKRLSEDFGRLLDSDHFVSTSIPLGEFTGFSKEGEFNESFVSQRNWLVGDRVFIGNVEIADLLYWQDGKLYIVHNKLGFGVTVRDVCSQILTSMNIVNRIKGTSDATQLREYYKRITKKYYQGITPTLSQDAFVELFLKTSGKDITYVIGYAQKAPVSAATRSNIAKFESVKLCTTDRKAFDFDLKIKHIPRA